MGGVPSKDIFRGFLWDFYGFFMGILDIFWGFDGNVMFLFGGMIIMFMGCAYGNIMNYHHQHDAINQK
jgi:hypothetical protein